MTIETFLTNGDANFFAADSEMTIASSIVFSHAAYIVSRLHPSIRLSYSSNAMDFWIIVPSGIFPPWTSVSILELSNRYP